MTDNTISQSVLKNQAYKQAGLFADDGDVVLLTKKEKKAIYTKAYQELNHDRLKAQYKTWYNLNKDIKNTQNKIWRKSNIEKANKNTKAWLGTHPDHQKKYYRKNVGYDAYKDKLQKYEDISQNSDGILLVECAYCGKLYAPTRRQVVGRIRSINETTGSDRHFYCSDICKTACPTYRRVKHYKFEKLGHSREVPASFRQMVLLNRNYTCETCGSTENGLHCHHINGYTESPMTTADLNNVKVLCSKCHKAVHSIPGCSFVDYSCRNQKQ